jgi:gamma-glutamylcyclotransferase (GGCT)/AIG2-like uncharacterized protein YtfP
MAVLFVYGTLRPGHAPREIAHVVDRLTLIGEGTVRARLYYFGDYPGIVLDDAAAKVPGILLALPDDDSVLAALDAYEGFIPTHPEANLFRRVLTTVMCNDGSPQTCWVYVYNQPV